MPKTNASSDVDRWLDGLEPGGDPGRDASRLRRIAQAIQACDDADQELRDAVAAARQAGDTWATIGMVLGTSRQAAYQRFSGSPKG